MADHHDYVALDWVKGEIQETLTQARQALESFVENPEDSTRIRFCLNYIHQVHGTLQMVEFYGAALLAEEMEMLAQSIMNGHVSNPNEAYQVLMQAILQLPAYLERVQSGRRDLPVILMPLLNDMRAARGGSLLSETSLFKPNLKNRNPKLPVNALARFSGENFTAFISKLRQMYQFALVGLLRDKDVTENLGYMAKVFGRLEHLLLKTPIGQLWWVCGGVIDGLANGAIPMSTSIRHLLRQVDSEFRRIMKGGSEALNEAASEELLKNLLYYVAKADDDTVRIRQIKDKFGLDDALPDDATVDEQRQLLAGPDREAIGSVVAALTEELVAVKDALDLFVRSGDGKLENLAPQLPILKQISDTMAVMGLGAPRKVLQEQLDVLQEIVDGDRQLDDAVLMDVAGSLLFVEATLSGMAGDGAGTGQAGSGAHMPPTELSEVHEVVVREARNGLEQAKDSIVQFIGSKWDHGELEDVPQILDTVRGGLAMIPLQRASRQLGICANYIREQLIANKDVPEWTVLDTLADVIASIEYYLERLADDHAEQAELLLDVADESLQALGCDIAPLDDDLSGEESESSVEAEPQVAAESITEMSAAEALEEAIDTAPETTTESDPAPEAAPAVAEVEDDDDDLIDDEVLEIFIEEAEEVHETITEFFPKWRANHEDGDARTEVRRAFHTLKGSGRMVGASVIGELAWSIENMLNRVIDQTINVHDALFDLIENVRQLIPELIKDFENKAQQETEQVRLYTSEAEAYSKGESWQVPAAEETETAAIDTADTVSDSEPELASLELVDNDEDAGEALDEAIELTSEPAETVAGIPEPSLASDVPEVQPEDDDSDAALLEIFATEAETHLQAADAFVEHFRLKQHPISISEELQRALHTLKGSAHMAGIKAVAELVTPLEKLIKELRGNLLKADGEVVDALEQGTSLVRQSLTRLSVTEPLEIPESEQYCQDLHDLHERYLAAKREEDEASGRDTQALIVFLSDGMNLLLDTAEWLPKWMPECRDDAEYQALIKELETLARGALMADLSPISDLCEALKAAYDGLVHKRIQATQAVTELLDEAHWALINMLDSMAAQQDVVAKPELIERLENLVQTSPIEPDADTSIIDVQVGDGSLELEEVELVGEPAELPDVDLSDDLSDEVLNLEDLEEVQEIEEVEVIGKLPGDGLEQVNDSVWELDGSDDIEDIEEVEEIELDADPATDVLGLVDIDQEPTGAVDEEIELDSIEPLESLQDQFAGSTDNDDQENVVAVDAELPVAEVEDSEEPNSGPVAQVVEEELPVAFDADPEMVEIFLEEATEIMDRTAASLQNWLEDSGQKAELDQLQRDLHTLKGGARMAGISPIGDLSHELEFLYEGLGNGRYEPSAPLSELIQACHDRLADQVDDIAASGGCVPANQLIAAISRYRANPEAGVQLDSPNETPVESEPETSAAPELTEQATAEVEQPDIGDSDNELQGSSGAVEFDRLDLNEMDADILEIFLEEAADLQEGIEQSCEAWSKAPQDEDAAAELMRHLHTLKGGARMASIKHLGDFTHDFEMLVTKAQQNLDALPEGLLDDVLGRQDIVFKHLENIRGQVQGDEPVSEPVPETATEEPAAEPTKAEPASPKASDEAKPAKEEGGEVVPFAPRESDKKAEDAPAVVGAAEALKQPRRMPQEMVKISADVLESLVNLAGETSISRGRIEQQVNDFGYTLDEMDSTINRVREQLRRLDIETQTQIISRHEVESGVRDLEFDPLEMDQYSELAQLSRSLVESATDLMDIKDGLSNKARDTETLLLQQARINTELQEGLMHTRMVPFSRMMPRLRRIVRQVSGELGKRVDLQVLNAEGQMDRTVMERMVAPLEHMLRNAIDHGIEADADTRKQVGKSATGNIRIAFSREGGDVVLRLSDDGQGVNLDAVRKKAIERGLMDNDSSLTDHEVMQFILQAGFSTAKEVTQISGRGVGMDVVHSEIKQLGGSVMIHSTPGEGSTFVVRLPFTVSVNRALMVYMGDDLYAIPLNTIEGVLRISPYELEAYYNDPNLEFDYAGQGYQVKYLGEVMKQRPQPSMEGVTTPLPVLLTRGAEHSVALQVDSLAGSREIVVKSMGSQFAGVDGVSGATILGDGRVVIILDLVAMIRSSFAHQALPMGVTIDVEPEAATVAEAIEEDRQPMVMVVDDSVTVRKVTSRLLERQGFDVLLAKDGMDAVSQLQDKKPDVMLLDIEMPRMDGFEVASTVKNDSRLHDIPIIMITSRTGEKHRERAFSLGVEEYLGKPFQEADLLATINKLLNADEQSEH
ncbi:Hpt domain-containing protein [Aestuariirhabdus sp. Z084]|uniref:Hpt domain-containing protein n=1 Tax=Aestuariirhabdus haliotis TaxID=2918751 RepID=UPI00201B3A7E|nr:Hpt domain-containing protein [Aestuariirhabdus haliotis]MCL6414133.1 Hpt domain-containing protein [Aestuariirhabdus haliotis]MCL6418065.1 Hpt domain-containing protein [Aestuariirhabdus haliotis]